VVLVVVEGGTVPAGGENLAGAATVCPANKGGGFGVRGRDE